jgi:Ser/Thr protein kinase RdoA (MazF antagonist)
MESLVKVAEGREAEMFEWDDGRLLRLLRNPAHAGSLQWEMAASRSAQASKVRVPFVYEALAVDGRPGLIVERIDGRDLLGEIAAKPWSVWHVGGECGRLHALVNQATASSELPELRARLASQISRSNQVPERFAKHALLELERLPEGDRLCHGDYHPGNVMRAGDELVVIDWPNATRGDYHADFARGTLILKLGDPPPESPAIIRMGARILRVLVRSAYERAYRDTLPVDGDLHERWETVRAVHRLTEAIESERPKLVRFLEKRISA